MSVYKNDNAEYLKEALKSTYETQTLKPNEIVIVLDGPITEALNEIIDSFVNDHKSIVKVVRLEKNSGLGNALRIGSDYCSHEYIMRMDSDDICLPRRFEKQIAYLKEHPEIDCLGGYIAEFNQSLDVLSNMLFAFQIVLANRYHLNPSS